MRGAIKNRLQQGIESWARSRGPWAVGCGLIPYINCHPERSGGAAKSRELRFVPIERIPPMRANRRSFDCVRPLRSLTPLRMTSKRERRKVNRLGRDDNA